MKRTIIIYGALLAALTGLLQFLEYKFFIRDFSIEVYIGAIALFFTGLGIWVGLKWTKGKKQDSVPTQLSENAPQSISKEKTLQDFSITQREFEVLQLLEKGHSNQEIADQLFVSLNTVKTHTSNLFSKLDVKRRTQAVQKAKSLGLFSNITK